MSEGLLAKAKDIEGGDEATSAATDEDIEPVLAGEVQTDGGGLLARAGASSEGGMDAAQIKKAVAASLASLLVLFIGYQVVMGFTFGDYSISVSDIEVDESDDALRVQIFIGTPMFGSVPSGDMTIEIDYGATSVYSGQHAIGSKLGWYEIAFSEFYQGNSRGAAANSEDIPYTLTVTIDGSSSEPFLADGAIMDRTLQTADAEIAAVTQTTSSDDNNGLNHLGASFRIGMGANNPAASDSADKILHVESDYQVVAMITFEGSEVYTAPTVSVDGSSANWSERSGVVENGWLDIGGDGSYTNLFGEAVSFVDRNTFYVEDGCYKISVTVTPDSPFGEEFTIESTQGYEFFWEYNENRDTTLVDSDNDGEEDDEREPYKPTEAC